MRIVIVNKFAHLTGGADRHCLSLAIVLRRRGHQVAFLSTDDPLNEEHEGMFVSCAVSHTSRDGLSMAAQGAVAANAIWNRESASAMRRLIEDFKPDVVHTHKLYPQLSDAPMVVAASRGVPVVQTLHDFEFASASPIDARGGRWDKDETRLSYRALNSVALPVRRALYRRRVSRWVCVSRFLGRVYERHGIDATVIPSFVDTAGSGGECVPFEDRKGVVFLGRLRPEKGVLDVVELARRAPQIPVTIIGSGVLAKKVTEAAACIPNLTVTGFVSDETRLASMLEEARIVVIPSRCQDTSNLVSLEALSHGTPVVAYANGGLAENVVDSGGGRITPVDVASLIAVTAELHDDRAAWQLLSHCGLQSFQARHTPDVYASALERVYESVA